jgi:hypothetical protein
MLKSLHNSFFPVEGQAIENFRGEPSSIFFAFGKKPEAFLCIPVPLSRFRY